MLTKSKRADLIADEARALKLLVDGLHSFPEVREAIAALNRGTTAQEIDPGADPVGAAVETSRNLLIAIGIIRLTLDLDDRRNALASN